MQRITAGIVLFSLLVVARAAELPDNRRFLESLEGRWQGGAVHSPAGPTPYDIRFRRQGEDCISGTAHNGFSNHTWTFCRDGPDDLKLDFLSDFGGNRQPIRMQAVATRDGAVVFYADSHPFMEVEVSVAEDAASVDVIHNDNLHVRIEWRRPAGQDAKPPA